MSEVWLARDNQAGSTVALKILSPALAAQPGYRDRLRKEWQLGLRMMHANIVRVFEYHDGERPFYSLQFVDGPDISVVAGAELSEILCPLALVADALRYAHAKDVVHRDLKASNVLLDGNGVPYLVDFGVAATGESDDDSSGGTAIGSSPQQIRGLPPGPADDIFSLGCLCAELISGNPPFGAAPSAEAIEAAQPPRFSKDRVPPAVELLLQEMLHPNAERRPDARTVATRLAELGFTGRPVSRQVLPRRAAAVDEPSIHSTEAIRAVRPAASAEASRVLSARQGFDARLVYGALGVALVIALGVIFGLPRLVEQQRANAVNDDVVRQDTPAPAVPVRPGGRDVEFNENLDQELGTSNSARVKAATDELLGELLSKVQRLELRGVDRWAGQTYRQAREKYAAGDAAYLQGDYRQAGNDYRAAVVLLDPLLERIDSVFAETMAAAREAFDAGLADDAVRLFDTAVAISPSSAAALAGLERARNLEAVLLLMEQGAALEQDLDLEGARQAYRKALALDSAWPAAIEAGARIEQRIIDWSFDERMSEGLAALAQGDYAAARAAFRVAAELDPQAREPRDGLVQVENALRLDRITRLKSEAESMAAAERWEDAVSLYDEVIEIEPGLDFANRDRAAALERVKIHETMGGYIAEPDQLSDPATLQKATTLLLQMARIKDSGPRLQAQKDELSRLLKRATTPLKVELLSDNLTDVAIYRVGKLGTFASRLLDLKPGTYVAVGSRSGYRDVRVEFRVGPEIELQPVVVRCEEQI
jgi:tetratricopeptide (TPR) repeat protein